VLSIDLDVALNAPHGASTTSILGGVDARVRQRFGAAAALPCLVAGLDAEQAMRMSD
jgi:hypothetical protein